MPDRDEPSRGAEASVTEMLLRVHEMRELAARVRERLRLLPVDRRMLGEVRATQLDEEAAELEQQVERLLGHGRPI